MEKTSLQYVGFVRVLSISQGPTIVKDVLIKKVSSTVCQNASLAWNRRGGTTLELVFMKERLR